MPREDRCIAPRLWQCIAAAGFSLINRVHETMRLLFPAACLSAMTAESSAPPREGSNPNLRRNRQHKNTDRNQIRQLDIFDDDRSQLDIFDSGVVTTSAPTANATTSEPRTSMPTFTPDSNATATELTVEVVELTSIQPTYYPTYSPSFPPTRRPSRRPTSKPGSEKPSTSKPGSQKPSTSKPGSQKPSTSKPTSQKPSTSKPTSPKPSSTISASQKPSTSKPTSRKPTTTKPQTVRPTSRPVSGTQPSFRLKLYWQSGYTWQGGTSDLLYCMGTILLCSFVNVRL